MIVSPQEYKRLLNSLTNPNNFANMIQIPAEEYNYEIDLKKREIEAPEFLSVTSEHNAEILWFKANRFFDNIDLATSTCWIQFVNAQGDELFCAVPVIVGLERYGNESILIPWPVGHEVTKKAGNIKFSFQFFKLSEDSLRFLYLINTKPANSKVLQGMLFDANMFDSEEIADAQASQIQASSVASLLHQLTEDYATLSGQYVQYWVDVV